MKTSIFSKTLALVVLLIGGSTIGFAQEEEKQKRDDLQKQRKEALRELPDITEAQIQEIEKLHNSMEETMKPMREQMKELHKQMRELHKEMDFDMEQAKRLVRETGQLETEMRLQRLQERESMGDILSDVQLKALHEKRKAMQEQRKAMHQKRKAEMKSLHKKRHHGRMHRQFDNEDGDDNE